MDNSKIVSYFTFQHPHVMSKKEKEKEKIPCLSYGMLAGLPAGANVKLAEETFSIMGRIRPSNGYNSEVDYSMCPLSRLTPRNFYKTQLLFVSFYPFFLKSPCFSHEIANTKLVDSMIVTHPSYKGQGHAKRLIQMGLRFADEKRRKWYAACWPTSVKLYRQLGFQYLAQETVDLSKYEGEGKEVLVLLVKEPARSVVEELRHQLLD